MTENPINIPSMIAECRTTADHSYVINEAMVSFLRQIATALEQAQAEIECLQGRLDHHRDWTQQRFHRLRKWVHEEVEPLSGDAAHHYFGIVANGAPTTAESVDWGNTLHLARFRADMAEAAVAREKARADAAEARVQMVQRFLDDADTRETKVCNVLRSAGIPETEPYPADDGIDDWERSLRAGGRCIPIWERVGRLVTERDNALAATPPAAEPEVQVDSESERAQRWGCNGTPATQQGEEDALTKYERLAEQFYRDTGMMAPGKDAPGQREDTFAERQQTWGEWLAKRMCRQHGEQQEARP